jgi:hypothetical protein
MTTEYSIYLAKKEAMLHAYLVILGSFLLNIYIYHEK